MIKKRCPHLVRHGKVGNNNVIEFQELCSVQRSMTPCCLGLANQNDYVKCASYKASFTSVTDKNGVRLNENSDLETRFGDSKGISDMELL